MWNLATFEAGRQRSRRVHRSDTGRTPPPRELAGSLGATGRSRSREAAPLGERRPCAADNVYDDSIQRHDVPPAQRNAR
jgi:hypothetical protein